ncbi:peptidoglycan recognition protein family protein [Oryzicola mucosus]|uniref:N-acetylmuramoyl-L-alanine amidase n=1 Tax=Oryzicola mucosus TaxID=2767425 RepID=A0A8J6PJH0_9HYPH|nr:N-acetylmuramoyl-L-alanine amidase [Oryzicola mucosus]MBD0414711.1 N-acetylmuramoyl-L-alanine amidase [Oryzicola mucosus]
MTGFVPDHVGAEVRVSPNFGPRRGPFRPDMIVLHYTGMESGDGAEAWLCNPASEVSSHYIVHEDGRIVQMVRESDRAWHAGKSSWRGHTDINSSSVGIEIVNPGHAFGYPAFPKRQIEAVIALCKGIVARHAIGEERILAHSDIAPGRKVDPGEKFPWRILADQGLGVWLRPSPRGKGTVLREGDEGAAVEELQSMLALYGYGLEITGVFDERTGIVVQAFQRHFRPRLIDGVADRSTLMTLRRLLNRVPFSRIL